MPSETGVLVQRMFHGQWHSILEHGTTGTHGDWVL